MSAFSQFAAELAEAAGRAVRRRFYSQKFTASKKSAGEFVTDADVAAEQLISDMISEKYPEHGFLGEESGARGDQDNCWVVDPIDGTTNFIHQYPNCAVSVAFCQGGRPVAGAIHSVALNETAVAARGEGALLHNRRLRVSGSTTVGDSLFVASGSLDDGMWALIRDLARRTTGMRRSGSTAMDFFAAAAGSVDMVVSGPVRFWDVAAGALILREAGGLLADEGGETSFAFGKPTGCFVAGAPGVFSPYLAALKKHRA